MTSAETTTMKGHAVNEIMTLEPVNAEIIEQANQYKAAIDSYIAQLDTAPRTREAYRKNLNYFFSWLESAGISEPHRAHILAYKEELKAKHTTTTAAAYLSAVRGFFIWFSAETGYPNISAGIKSPRNKRTGHLKDALSLDQAQEVIKTLQGESLAQKRDKALISLLLFTGLRTIEAARANIEDIRSLEGCTVLYVQGKGRESKDEFVKLSQPVQEAIRNYLTARGQVSAGEALFTSVSRSNSGSRLTTRSISRIAKNTLKAAGIDTPSITAHSFRHTAVTLALRGNAPIREVQKMARHASVSTTERYSHDIRRLDTAAEDYLSAVLMAG